MPTGSAPAPALRRVAHGLAAGYLLVAVWVIVALSPKVPYADPWRFLATYLELPFPQDVLAADNGHREVLPNLLRLAELEWFDANQWLQIGTGLALAGLLLRALWRQFGDLSPEHRAAGWLLVAVGIGWLGNARKLAHGNEIVPLFWILGCLWFGLGRLAGPRGGWWATLAALLATLTFGAGAACFPAFLVAAALQRLPWRTWWPLLPGALVGALLLLLGGGGETAAAGFDPLRQAELLLRWLGAPFVWVLSPALDTQHAARLPWGFAVPVGWLAGPVEAACGPRLAARWPALLFGGLAGLGLLLASWRTFRQRPATTPIALGLAWFGVAVGGLVVAARLPYFGAHPDQLTSQRYLPWSMLVWLGLGLVVVRAVACSGRQALRYAIAVALLFLPSQVWTGRNAWKQLRVAEWTAVGAAVGVLDAELPLVETEAGDLLRAVPLLRAAGTSVFAWPETRALAGPVPATAVPVELRDLVLQPVANLFPGRGSAVQFLVDATGRFLLVDGQDAVVGIASRVLGDDRAHGFCRGAPSALRAVQLR